MTKFLYALSLSRKSGNLVLGFDEVKNALGRGKVKLLITAGDLSPKSEKNIRHYSDDDIPFYKSGLSRYELSQVTGRQRGVMAVTDENLARLCLRAISTGGEE